MFFVSSLDIFKTLFSYKYIEKKISLLFDIVYKYCKNESEISEHRFFLTYFLHNDIGMSHKILVGLLHLLKQDWNFR